MGFQSQTWLSQLQIEVVITFMVAVSIHGTAIRSTSLVVRETATKMKLYLAILTSTQTYEDGRNIQLLSTKCTYKNNRKKEIKKVLDLS